MGVNMNSNVVKKGGNDEDRISGDCISRRAAIDRINKQREHLQPDIYPQDKIGDAAYRICAEFIERLPSAQPEQRWIPVSERLPEEHDSVFAKFKGTLRWNKSMFEKMSKSVIVTSEFEDGSRIAEKAYTVDGVWNLEVKGVSRKVIAWMPFPEPYQKRGEQE